VQINIVVADKSTLIPRCHDHKGRMAYRLCRNSTSGTVRSPSHSATRRSVLAATSRFLRPANPFAADRQARPHPSLCREPQG
jgi:hypothetical protein